MLLAALQQVMAIFAGLVYLILSIIVKFAGTNWINKLMPPIVIGPTVAVIGGLCVVLYGFIAASGFLMLHDVDFSEHKNIFVVAVILVIGVGGLAINFRKVEFFYCLCIIFRHIGYLSCQ